MVTNMETRPTSRKRRIILLCLALVVATLAVYYAVNQFEFLNYDDNVVVTDNYHVKYGLDWDGVKWAFTTYHQANWVPLTWISHALDCQLFGLNAGRHHDTNLLLHIIDVLLLFWVLQRATGYIGRSFMVAALFALHPVNVESVAWVASRRNMLSMLFFFLALGAYRWYALKPRVDRYLLVTVLIALAFMAKAQVVTFPAVLLLWDYWPLGRMFANAKLPRENTDVPPRSLSFLILEKIPLFVLAAVGAVVTSRVQVAGGGIDPYATPFFRAENALFSYMRYLGKAVWPVHLANLYPLPLNSLRLWQPLTALCLLLAITALVLLERRHRYLPVGWLWFLGTLLPMIGVMQLGRHAMADRYAYLPYVGLFIMVCWGVPDLYAVKFARQDRSVAGWLPEASVALLLVLGIVAHRQVSYWRNDETLWTHTLQVTRDNYEAEDNYASDLMSRWQCKQALEHLQRAAEIEPSYALAPFHIGQCEQQMGNLQAAVEQYKRVLDLTESDAAIQMNIGLRFNAFDNLANTYLDMGDTAAFYRNHDAAQALARHYLATRSQYAR
jgi:tetratricopeptide (TPR) repeat protein